MRNAEDDLKACNAATPGPWQVEKYYHEEPYEQYIKSAAIVDEDSTITRNDWSNPLEADLDFIALAREALPYWIKRAQELEKVLCRYEQWEADLLMDDQAWGSGLPCFTQGLYDKWMELQEQRNKVLRKSEKAEVHINE